MRLFSTIFLFSTNVSALYMYCAATGNYADCQTGNIDSGLTGNACRGCNVEMFGSFCSGGRQQLACVSQACAAMGRVHCFPQLKPPM